MEVAQCLPSAALLPTPPPRSAAISACSSRTAVIVGRLDYEACVRAHPGIELVDLRGKAVGPGLIDLHCHGAMKADFADGTPGDFRTAAGYHLAHGTTTMLAAIGSCTTAEMLAACRTARQVKGELPNLHGVHLEGPYFSRGAFRLPSGGDDPRTSTGGVAAVRGLRRCDKGDHARAGIAGGAGC